MSFFRPVVLAIALVAGFCAPSWAQTAQTYVAPDLAAQRAEMGKLHWLVGHWEGEGWTVLPTGERAPFRQTERVETRLDGALLVIEGTGFEKADAAKSQTPIFNAFAIVSFNDQSKTFAFRSYAKGYASTFDAVLRPDGVFEWRITPPVGPRMRYLISQPSPGEWFEIGERSTDGGAVWTQFFEMRLRKLPERGNAQE